MQTLKKEFLKQARHLSAVIYVPLGIVIIALSITLWISVFNSAMNEIRYKAGEFVTELDSLIGPVETNYNTLMEDLLNEGYREGFEDEVINRIKAELAVNESGNFSVSSVNYYRLTGDFVVFETDFKPDLNKDFSSYDYFSTNLSGLKPGEIFLDGMRNEKMTGDVRLYGYIRLDDGTFLEIGVKFDAVIEKANTLIREIFDDNTTSIRIYENFSNEENAFFTASLESGKPVFRHVAFTTARYFVTKESEYGTYCFIITIQFLYPVLLLLNIAGVVFLLIIFRVILSNKIDKLSHTMTNSIITLEENVRHFHLSRSDSEPVPVKTNIQEIHSMAETFLKMRNEISGAYEEMSAMNQELEAAYMENQDLISKMESLIDVPDYLLYLDNIEKFLIRSYERILQLVTETDYAYVTINENNYYHFLRFKGVDVDKVNALNLKCSDFPIGDTVVLKEFDEGEYLNHYTIPELAKHAKKVAQALIIPVQSGSKKYGSISLMVDRESFLRLNQDDYRVAVYFSNYLKGYLMIKEFSDMEEELQKETIYALIKLLEKHDPYTKGHSENVARLASNFAYFLNLPEETAQDLYWSGIVHDMGKILIPHNVLNKPSKLSIEEFEIIKKHPVYAFEVLKDNVHMQHIAMCIKHHHEKYNGSGYPDGLKGEAIPFESRILTLADCWDAMISERVYKKGMRYDDALQEIEKNSGIHFDPTLTAQWVKFIEKDL